MKQWSEKTSTSSSGRNLSLYKSLLVDKDFTDFFRRMCELPVVHGFAPTRWAHALKLLLEKDPGSPRVSRLRAIYLLEADYNLVLRIIWGRRMMWKAREHNMFMTAQQAQPGRLAIGAVLNKFLTFDLFRQTKTNGASGDADATG